MSVKQLKCSIISHLSTPYRCSLSLLSSNKLVTGNLKHSRNLTTAKNKLTTSTTTPITANPSRNNVTFNANDKNDNEIKEQAFRYVNGNDDKFLDEYQRNRIPITDFQRFILSAGSSIAALLNPQRHDMIACLGETTGLRTLSHILELMQSTTEGTEILLNKPRINSKTVDLDALGQLPDDTFGFRYKKFLDDNKVTPDSRMEVKFLGDPEIAYIMTRYRESHDLIHTVLGMPTNMLGEVTVKWIEAMNIGLPMCYGGAVFGAIRLRPKQRQQYRQYYLPWALRTGKTMKPLMGVYWEKRWEQKIDELRTELNITPFAMPSPSV